MVFYIVKGLIKRKGRRIPPKIIESLARQQREKGLLTPPHSISLISTQFGTSILFFKKLVNTLIFKGIVSILFLYQMFAINWKTFMIASENENILH